MIIKKDSQALELRTKKLAGNTAEIVNFLLKNKKKLHTNGIPITDNLISDVEEFLKRNTIVKVPKDGGICCERCLKAYTLERANSEGLEKRALEKIDKMFNCEIGHQGYYLDGNNLLRI